MNSPAEQSLPHQPASPVLFLEAEQLALQLEAALHDPAATEDAFFSALDRFADVLSSLELYSAARVTEPVYIRH